MRFCPFCSAENADELAVCQACGRRLPPLPPRRGAQRAADRASSCRIARAGARARRRADPAPIPPRADDPPARSAPATAGAAGRAGAAAHRDRCPRRTDVRCTTASGPRSARRRRRSTCRDRAGPRAPADGSPARTSDADAPTSRRRPRRPTRRAASHADAARRPRRTAAAAAPDRPRRRLRAEPRRDSRPACRRADAAIGDRCRPRSRQRARRAAAARVAARRAAGRRRSRHPRVEPPAARPAAARAAKRRRRAARTTPRSACRRVEPPPQHPPAAAADPAAPSVPPPIPAAGRIRAARAGRRRSSAATRSSPTTTSRARRSRRLATRDADASRRRRGSTHRGAWSTGRSRRRRSSPVPEIPEPGPRQRRALRLHVRARALAAPRRDQAARRSRSSRTPRRSTRCSARSARAARGAQVEGRVFSAENAAITAAEERDRRRSARRAPRSTAARPRRTRKFVDIERERNAKLTEAERMVDEAQSELHAPRGAAPQPARQAQGARAPPEGLPQGRRGSRSPGRQRARWAISARSCAASPRATARKPPRSSPSARRSIAGSASLERPISEATARLDAAQGRARRRQAQPQRRPRGPHAPARRARRRAEAQDAARSGWPRAEIQRRLVTLGTLVNLNRIEDPQFAELYTRIDRLRGAITARTTEIEKLTAEREAYDRGTLVRGVATIGGAILIADRADRHPRARSCSNLGVPVPKVLVSNNSELLRHFTAPPFQRLGLELLVAKTADEARALFVNEEPALVVLDAEPTRASRSRKHDQGSTTRRRA